MGIFNLVTENLHPFPLQLFCTLDVFFLLFDSLMAVLGVIASTLFFGKLDLGIISAYGVAGLVIPVVMGIGDGRIDDGGIVGGLRYV